MTLLWKPLRLSLVKVSSKSANVEVGSYKQLSAVEWRQEEIERINTTLEGAERKAALCMLLDQETQLLAAIDRHKLEAGSENKDLRIQSFLEKVGV